MSTTTSTQTRPDAGRRVTIAVLAVLLVAAIVAGTWNISGRAATWFPGFVVPEAAGLPSPLPALRIAPLGRTTWLLWAIDLIAVPVMLGFAWLQLRAAARRHPSPSHRRAFGRGVVAVIVGLVAANVVRSVFLSFVTHAGIAMFAGLLVASIVVSAFAGVLLGLVAGLAGAIAVPRDRA
ncbi:hypothetical protein ACSAGD_01285 [Paramicrobacterium sp. CJ85]|uniref:hypothetical protein n=1 Tax=Paramicrobacterium sp. CJ85 TaxID=3445355 RepID=UPI003F6215E7